MLKRCEYCGNEFEPKNWHHDQRFCSVSCSAFGTAKKRGQGTVETPCENCGKLIRTFASEKRKWCSKECRKQSSIKSHPLCEVCGKPVRLMRNRYCSKHCSVTARPRPGINSWSGFYQRAQKANPNSMPCILCGAPGKHRHHPNYGEPEFTIWLCISCHRKFHGRNKRLNGKGDMPSSPLGLSK